MWLFDDVGPDVLVRLMESGETPPGRHWDAHRDRGGFVPGFTVHAVSADRALAFKAVVNPETAATVLGPVDVDQAGGSGLLTGDPGSALYSVLGTQAFGLRESPEGGHARHAAGQDQVHEAPGEHHEWAIAALKSRQVDLQGVANTVVRYTTIQFLPTDGTLTFVETDTSGYQLVDEEGDAVTTTTAGDIWDELNLGLAAMLAWITTQYSADATGAAKGAGL